ncbi:rho GTPase-activating protein 20-like [Hippoglossus hippoglossus]|uniref:rho GTPase-activating protein 20-like n=1 Tax=Hippoglossus hippoglossus TaxID=8267 RepID=UPI00148C6EB9|nr:rho GTPase-activating protein 20-like [Hippoglossus hippoglossus]
MDNMSPQQQQDSLSRGGAGQQENKRRMKSQSYRRQSAPSLVFTKALTRSKTVSRESFLLPLCPETCPLVQSFLAASDRSFLLHAHAQLKTGMQTQDRHLFLFDDLLVIAKAKSANHFKQKAQVRVCDMWTASCMDEVCEGSTNPERSFVMGWPTCNCGAMFSSAEQKERWLSLLKSRIKEEKEKEEPKTIPMRVYGKGINSFAVTKTLPVSNSDSTNEVIRLALQQFSIIGNVKDYQLWVISKRDNTPYPLIGHEFPFSIQMSHVRCSVSQGGRDASAPAADRQRALQAEQLQVSKQCQFILKPRPTETLQQVSADLFQKPFKRRRSLITWAFWRGSSSHLNELSLAPRGFLFGQPLSAVCVEDALPKPVMDMLAFLYHEGSWTRGIFRRPAGARAVRELRDTLDAGEFQLPLTRDHVFIIAGVFKDFLRSIPGSLLCSELHEEWMDVLEEEEEEEERVQDIQRMICRLPKGNALLLRHLLAVLQGIEGNAHENQMTSFNLSVCIAPSMLWPPGVPCSPEVEGEGAKKVCELVKFMIEHCQQILGEDPTSLFGGLPQKLNTDELGSESWKYPPTDSSYDSLENELDNSSGGSPGLCSRMQLRSKALQGSLDSILTFSDYDQDTDPDTHHDTHHTQADSPLGLKLNPLRRSRGRRRDPHLSSPTQDSPTMDASSTLDSLSLDGRHRQRRRSEPAIAYMTKFRPCVSGSTDGLTGEDEEDEEEPLKKPSIHTLAHTHSGGELNLHGGALGASSSSLSSTATSPAPTRSSLDSLDSLSSDHCAARRGIHPSTPCLPSNDTSASLSTSVGSALTSNESPELETIPKGSPPREALSWGTLRGCRGLHPNSWLRKDRRLSLTQQDNLEKEDEDKTGEGSTDMSLKLGKLVPEKGKAGERGGGKLVSSSQQKPKVSCKDTGGGGRVKQDSSSPPSHHRSTGNLHFPKSPLFHSSRKLSTSHASTASDISNQRSAAERDVSELKQPSTSLFYKHGPPSLSLFKRHKTHSVKGESNTKLHQRRVSEPGRQVVEQAATLGRARLPSDPGLKVSEVDPQGETSEARFCVSPCATKAVKDYFSSHRRSNPQSSQQVALALVESRREWLKRCNDPKAEPDFEQLLFAEESYV